MIRRPPRSTQSRSSAASDVYKRQLVKIFEEVRRVLRDDGTLWLNLGDTYRANQLLGVPWRVALALQDDGWLLRSDIIWHKPNAMPSSVRTRPTTDHEYLFLFCLLYTSDAADDLLCV